MSQNKTSQKVEVGNQAPDFTLQDQHGTSRSLHEFLGKQAIVLYFYPKDDTPGCTAEACSFRDSYESFTDAGAVVIGVSSDSEESHEQFAAKHHLPFTLLSDSKNVVRKLYGVPATLGLLPGRVTYIIDAQGVVQHIFDSQFAATKHISESLEILQKLSQ